MSKGRIRKASRRGQVKPKYLAKAVRTVKEQREARGHYFNFNFPPGVYGTYGSLYGGLDEEREGKYGSLVTVNKFGEFLERSRPWLLGLLVVLVVVACILIGWDSGLFTAG